MLDLLTRRGCEVTVLPASTTAPAILAGGYDGVLLTNGPGDPEPLSGVIATAAELIGRVPVFGICLGHQILGLALGGATYKLPFGHRGGNHPVRRNEDGRVEITCQNHGFAVTPGSLERNGVRVTHVNLNDSTIEGIAVDGVCFSVQYHPESGPGPRDARYLFERFSELMASFPAVPVPAPELLECVHTTEGSELGQGRPQVGQVEEGQAAQEVGPDKARGRCQRGRTPPPLADSSRADAGSHRPHLDPGGRLRTHRHRPGLRVRLLRNAGVPGVAAGGLSGGPGELEPGHDHDRPRAGRGHLHRADHRRLRRRSDRAGAPRRAVAHARGPDGTQRRHGAPLLGHARRLLGRAHRGLHRDDPEGRGPARVQGNDGRRGVVAAALGLRLLRGRDRGRRRGDRAAGHHQTLLRARRRGFGSGVGPRLPAESGGRGAATVQHL